MDNHTKEVRSYNMSKIRSRNTKPEVLVRKYLFALGFRYKIDVKNLPGRPDIVLPRYKTVIFVNGCFWHMHKGCEKFVLPASNREYWEKKLNTNKNRDIRNVEKLQQLGWKVIIVWECELRRTAIDERIRMLCDEIVKGNNR